MDNTLKRQKIKESFLSDLEKTIDLYDDFDDQTPVAQTGKLGNPPEWWSDMMDLQRTMKKILNKHK